MGEVIAFVSGKGGTGKTSACAGIAQALAEEGKQVLCIDCDVGLRSLDIALALGDTAALSFGEVCSGAYGLDAATRHPQCEGICFLTAPVSGSFSDVDAKAFHTMLETAKNSFDYILLDGPSGIGDGFRLVCAPADRICVVATQDPAGIRCAQRVSDLLEGMEKQNFRLLLNRVDTRQLARRRLTVDDIMDETGMALLGLIPEDENISTAAAVGKLPLQTKKGAAAACRRIARRMQGESVAIGI